MMILDKKYKISIPLKRDISNLNNAKGKALESFVMSFLKYQNYHVTNRVRETGTEVDLLCKSTMTDNIVIVECKAQETPIQSEAVNKLFSDMAQFDADNGWIISKSDLGAEARTRLSKLNEKTPKSRMKFISGHELIENLMDAEILVGPAIGNIQQGAEWHLCLFEAKKLWAIPILNNNSQPIGCLAFDASSGTPINPEEAPDIKDTDFTYSELGWLPHQTDDRPHKAIAAQPIISVIPGDEWSDYRPSRPIDFVGRATIISEIDSFFTSVKNGETPSRIFGIKGKSGWGKSSLALKLASEFSKKNVYLLPVDCRAANSSMYADLAVAKVLSNAARERFHGPLFAPKTEFQTNPFDENSVSEFLRDVQRSNGLICLVFDQFEAIIHRNDLRPVFERLRMLALFVEEFRGSFIIGFSWKTDGTVGSDNPGYHMWHSLADRRRDFEVDRFTRDDADQFINLAIKGASVALPKAITKYILEQYAGYPWLLKKLIKHSVDLIKKSNGTQNISSYFDVKTLFDNDLQELSVTEIAALKFIAKGAPIEHHIVEEKYNANAISVLIDKRLLIKTGSQLNLYWDTFRDYLLFGQLPQIPNTYVPTLSVRKIRSVIRLITQSKTATYKKLGSLLGISAATADNTVRDLTNMGLVSSNRTTSVFTSNCQSPMDATRVVIKFLESHAVFHKARDLINSGFFPTVAQMEEVVRDDYAFISIDSRTLRTYVRKILVYCLDFGLLEKRRREFKLGMPVSNILDGTKRNILLDDGDIFRGAAPPDRVIELLNSLRQGRCQTLREASRSKLRNAVYAASRLGLVVHRDGSVLPVSAVLTTSDIKSLVIESASRVEPIQTVFANIDIEEMNADEVGGYLSDLFELNWSPSSCRRYGTSIRDWCIWLREAKTEQSGSGCS